MEALPDDVVGRQRQRGVLDQPDVLVSALVESRFRARAAEQRWWLHRHAVVVVGKISEATALLAAPSDLTRHGRL